MSDEETLRLIKRLKQLKDNKERITKEIHEVEKQLEIY